MSMRWRADGRLVCAAMTGEEPGDTYIDDRLHYQLSLVSRAILADPDHEVNALWHWVHHDVAHPNSGFLRAVSEPIGVAAGTEVNLAPGADEPTDEQVMDAFGDFG